MPKKTLADLKKLVQSAETADKFLFAEQRSNVLIIAGEHYTKRNSKYWNRLRETRYLNQDQRLRITKNHIQKIMKIYVNEIISHSPGIVVTPNNEKEMQDQKAAELNNAVWLHAKKKHRLEEKRRSWAEDFIHLGEVFVKVVWNDKKGEVVGFQQKVDEQTGEPMHEPGPQNEYGEEESRGEMIQDESKPVFSGEFEFKKILPFNIRRPNSSQTLEDAEWLAEVDLVRTKTVKSWVADDEKKSKKVTEDANEEMFVFDGNLHGYDTLKDMTQVYSQYWRPSPDYPNGYYYIFTKSVVLFEGELPYGIFPICYAGFDNIQTSPRARSLIKHLRPYQIEINRCASKIAEHQVTLGDDKLLVQSGSKMTNGVSLPGVRSLQFTGREPVILAGRSGEQYLEYMTSQIGEMYAVANVAEEQAEKTNQGQDPLAQLFKSMKQKKKFVIYAEKFSQFFMDVGELYLKLARHYYDEQTLIPMIGRHEYVNISEFKNTEPLFYQIKIEPRADDLDTQYGKQLAIQHTLQYAGKNMEKEDIGRMIRAMPFGNFEEGFEDLTIDYDAATNVILALDRGEEPIISRHDKPEYMLRRLTARMRQSDFQLLPPEQQQMYAQVREIYTNIEAEQQQQIMAAQADFIPTGGAKVKVDFYVPKKGNPEQSERAILPTESIDWLINRMNEQGSSQDRLGVLDGGTLAEIAGKVNPPQGNP